MKFMPFATMNTALSAGLAVALLTTTVGSTAMASNYNNQSVYRDGNFNTLSQKLRKDLSRSGYQVMDIQSDNYRGNQAVTVYAKKNNQPYELKYTYPALKLISSSQKDWSNVWQDKNNHRQNGNGYYGNNNHNNGYKNNNRNNNIEDNIKKEARYPAIKQRAIRKVADMGYRVKDIELNEKNNRGVFEIEAKSGSQDYDIILGYPNLNVIKLEKD
ncbi:hypothetical protein ES754_07835 [Psychrobacter frigidicola]|uniref:PepSY domain-containing protein n=1 Tax=Psychrobacter frigidicola TaxID=45611 RepID=A0A5C7A0N7_9GAMM|nr:PepSY domain-containing protein [Psychrobacter frigidicola]TXD96928.1 hypothetical protein ES754_07835 [Psychrobacter frigidicola]